MSTNENPACDRDRPKRHKNIDRQRSGIARRKRLQLRRLLCGKFPLLHKAGHIENDFHLGPRTTFTTRPLDNNRQSSNKA